MKDLAAPLGLAGLRSRSKTERSDAQFFDWRVASVALCVFVGYYFGAKVGFALTFHPHPVSVLWPPNSILLAALLLMPKPTWWLLLLAALAAGFGFSIPAQSLGDPPRRYFPPLARFDRRI